MKRITTTLIAIAMICTLAGCGSNTTTSATRSDVNTSASDTVTDTIVDDIASDTTVSDTDITSDVSDKTDDVANNTEVVEPTEPEVYVITADDENFHYTHLEDGGVEILGIPKPVRDSISHIDAWHVIYPRELGGSPVLDAGAQIDWSDQIVSVEFEDGYTRIPDYALHAAEGLETAVIPNTVTEIGQRAFVNCTGLKEINIPDSVIKIGERAFYDCGDVVITYRGNTYSGDSIEQLYVDINANSAE